MIILKTQQEIDGMCRAGELSARALRMTGEMVQPGITTLELDKYCENVIRMGGGTPGFKGYGGFPYTICASVNGEVVHGFPSEDTILQEGDIISIDTGAVVDGWYGDNAWTFPVGDIAPRTRELLEVTEKCMWAGLDQAIDGNHIGDIGHAVQEIAEAAGFGVIREYVGHGIGRDMHEDPNVPNYGHRHRGPRIDVGACLAIEPMITEGTYHVHTMPNGWTVVTDDGLPAAHFEKTIAVTANGTIVVSKE